MHGRATYCGCSCGRGAGRGGGHPTLYARIDIMYVQISYVRTARCAYVRAYSVYYVCCLEYSERISWTWEYLEARTEERSLKACNIIVCKN